MSTPAPDEAPPGRPGGAASAGSATGPGSLPPVIAIDGPSASGKGAVAARVAETLGFHYLDSGALYRAVALAALDFGTPLEDAEGLRRLIAGLRLRFIGNTILMAGRDVADEIRTERVSGASSRVAAVPAVRAALLDLQRSFRRAPGLAAEGRDMGTVVFPDATLKVFLTAGVEERARRRYKQLIEKGFSANLPDLLRDLRERDERDRSRAVAPLRPAADARELDSSSLTVEEVVAVILDWYRERHPA